MNLLYIGIGVFTTLYIKDKKFRDEANHTVNDLFNQIKGALNDKGTGTEDRNNNK